MEWYCLYCKPRHERKVELAIQKMGIEAWCPVQKSKRKWSDRIKIVEIPVLGSYILVRCEESNRNQILQMYGAIRFLFLNGKIAKVRESEITVLKQILDPDYGLDVERMPSSNYSPGEEIEIFHPSFGETFATVIQNLSREVVVLLPGLNMRLRISKGRILNS